MTSYRRLIMEKVETGDLCCLMRDISNFSLPLQKCLSSSVHFILFLSKSLELIGCHGNIKGTFL